MNIVGTLIEVTIQRKTQADIHASVFAELGPDGWEFAVIEADHKMTFMEESKARRMAYDAFFE
ncbi:BcepGomrgp49 [Burkholderia phage BcepGomr]|uniref:BcepGomrgp49 n=1 Tax=Burkholderia phage BcepGomr TaxID=437329 RepID=UPI0001503502|nr:BcepGomrgp49 [Burkholderia phage BcepGomr]ABP63620.1 BcepGomrgp49 [Burkholderia phage BcepGomr]